MSATLTWFNSGLGTKTGTAIGNFFDDYRALIDTTDAGSDFSWVLASSNVGSTPYQVTLKPKNGDPGRILIVAWSSAPAGTNTAILEFGPTTNTVYIAYFPAGNVDTPSNLTAASGTIMGDDTGVVKCATFGLISSVYSASFAPFYFDSAEGVVFGTGHAGTTTVYIGFAGALLVDAADTAYSATFGLTGNSVSNFGSATAVMPWISSGFLAGSSNPGIKSNYGATNRSYFQAFITTGGWGGTTVGAGDAMSDTSVSKRWYAPVPLIAAVSGTKGEGLTLKLRQIAWGSGATGPFESYSTTGPVVQSRQFNPSSAGGNGHPWCTNFKV